MAMSIESETRLASRRSLDLTDHNGPLSGTLLHIAASKGHIDVVKCLVDEFGCSPATEGFENRNILHCACEKGHCKLVEFLITRYKLDPLSVDSYGNTALHYAVLGGSEEVAKLLITKYKCPVDCVNNRHRTPLHYACREGHLNFVNMLVFDYNADVSAQDLNGNSPLHTAVLKGHTEVITSMLNALAYIAQDTKLADILLTQHKLDPLTVDDNGDSLLHHAALCGNEEVAKLLIIEYKCPVDCVNNRQQTPLHYACRSGHLNLVKMLVLECKADFKICDNEMNTPVYEAVCNGHTYVFDEFFDCKHRDTLAFIAQDAKLADILLTQHKLDPLTVDDNGDSLLHHAALCGNEEVAKLLITKYKLPVDCVNSRQQTALHHACRKGHIKFIRMLVLEYKANLKNNDDETNTPVYEAVRSGHTYVFDEFFDCKHRDTLAFIAQYIKLVDILLAQQKLDPLTVDDNGDSLLHHAALCGNEEVAKLLITKHECPVNCVNNRQQTALHHACRKGNLNFVKMLVYEYKADLKLFNDESNTPLYEAVHSGHTYVFDEFFDCKHRDTLVCIAQDTKLADILLTQHKLDPQTIDDKGDSLLHHAALCGNEEVAKLVIIEYKCPVDCANNRQQTPLHYACRSGHLNLVKMLVLECKADFKICDNEMNTPVYEAVCNGHTYVFDEFFDCEHRDTLAFIAQDTKLANILLTQHKLDPLTVDDNGDNLLHHAALCGNEEVAKLLITKYECPVDCVNNRQQTPLHYACRKGHLNFVKMLALEYKADTDARDHETNTPLHEAALCGHDSVIRCLLNEFHCSPNIKGLEGRNILHQSCNQDNDSLVEELVDKFKVSLLSTDNDGNTPLHIASMSGSIKSLHVLLNNYHAPIFLRNKAGKSSVDVAKNDEVKEIIRKYLKFQHSRIVYDYKRVQTLSSKKYKGAHRLTRIFVVGNVESGKSTLVESLKREGFFSSLTSVSEATVPPHTSGIIPSVHFSKAIGRVIYYDFAGDPEYYSSHSAIVANVMQAKYGTNIFLVVVNLTKPIPIIREELGYWLSFISYHMKASSVKCKVIVIGSHADRITIKADKTSKLLSVCQFILQYCFDIPKLIFDVVDMITLNCRQPRSSRGVKDIILKTIENTPRYNLSEEAAILLGLLDKDFKNVITCDLQTLITHIKDTGVYLPTMARSLYQVVEDLHSLGLLMSLQSEKKKLEDTLLLLNIPKLTNKVHKLLFSKKSFLAHDTSMGVLTHSFLNRHLPEYISVDCLVQLQYCQLFSHAEVGCDQSVVSTNDPNAPTLLYFPALCTIERKQNIITPDEYTYSIGWFAECRSKFHYFPARFLHVLLLRLAYTFAHPIAPHDLESDGEMSPHLDIIRSNCRCTMWKNGLHWHMKVGVECIVELVNNNRGLVVITKSTMNEERRHKCGEMLFKIIEMSMKAKEELCRTITLKQYLIPLDCCDTDTLQNPDKLFDLDEVCQDLKEGNSTALSVSGERTIEVSELVHLEEFIIRGK